ncbi:MAG TPA: ATP-binding cassette domain-containing protein, partial [Holophagaceae bacterium]|nr:ATP-binding cassette domain-containing protein [Holophagaceae bacterium]
KPVTALSGGERARLSIATLIREGVNLLLLDEPTNHMDIPSMEAVEDAILAFPGAAIVVTHDRYLLGRVADSLLRIHDGAAEFKDGGYEDHQAWVDLDISADEPDEPIKAGVRSPEAGGQKQLPTSVRKPEAVHRSPESPATKGGGRKPDGKPVDKEKQKQVKRLERHVSEAEAKVAELESKLAALQQALAAMDPNDWQAFSAKLDEQKNLESELAYAMTAWEEAQSALESTLG